LLAWRGEEGEAGGERKERLGGGRGLERGGLEVRWN
jgi:hypothetical protein